MQALKALVAIMGVLIIVGVGTVITLVSQRLSESSKKVNDISIALPNQTQVKQVFLEAKTLSVLVADFQQNLSLLTFNKTSGALLQRINFKSAPLEKPEKEQHF